MIKIQCCGMAIIFTLIAMPFVIAQDLSGYRGFHLGMSLAAAAKHADVNVSEAKTIHRRPAVIQELEWKPVEDYYSSGRADSVEQVLLSFYNGELYRIVISYDRYKTEGLTDEDLIEAISAKYGAPVKPIAKIITSSPAQVYSDIEKVIARWEDSQYSFNLFRFSYRSVPGLLAYSKRLDSLAQASIVQAIRLNEQEAPQREIDRLRKQDEEKDAAKQKARPANKANFRF